MVYYYYYYYYYLTIHTVTIVTLTAPNCVLQVMELQEACQIHQGLLQGRNNSLQDMKAIVKTWRNRLPVIADDLSHWSDIFTWRQHHYQFIVTHYNGAGEGNQVGEWFTLFRPHLQWTGDPSVPVMIG